MRTITILFLCVFFAGCGERIKTAAISGRITYKDRPVPYHDVIFEPLLEDNHLGDFATGRTDEDGRYTLRSFKLKKNAVGLGRCRVRIVWNDPNADPEKNIYHDPPFKLPPSASDGSLTFNVPEEGTENANFDF